MNCVNIFFSCDDNYIPFLGVTLASLKENRDPARHYEIRILHTGLREDYMARLTDSFSDADFSLSYYNIAQKVEQFSRRLHTRDYFSQSTYYRLFIPQLFPELDKALYLDSDLVVRGDISRLYDTVLGDNLVGAVTDAFVSSVEQLKEYVCNRLDLSDAKQYFNAGVLLMNLKAMREADFQQVFLSLLQTVTFRVAQDQDYLNAICRNRVKYIGSEWNAMPKGAPMDDPQLIHYNVDSKPWHTDQVPYEAYFWDYADRSPFRDEIHQIRKSYSQADTAQSREETVNLIALATRQAHDDRENRRIHAQIARVVGL